MSVIQSYFKETSQLENKYGDQSLVLMMVGSFYEVYGYKNKITGEVYGSNIEEFARICDFNISEKKGIKCKDKEVILMAGFPEYQIEKYIAKLQEHSFTVAVITQTKLPDGKITRHLETICSPGTHFSLDEASVLSNNIICIRLFRRIPSTFNKEDLFIIGMASMDIITGETKYTEHRCPYRHDPSSYDFIERIVSIDRPNEAIIMYHSDQIQNEEIEEAITYMDLQTVRVHRVNISDQSSHLSKTAINSEKRNIQMEIIKQYYPTMDNEQFYENYRFHEFQIASHAFCMLLDFVYEHNRNLMEKIRLPSMEFDSNHLYLGNHSLRQLNILSDNRYKGKKGSVIDFINNCVTSMGKRKLKEFVLHPLVNKKSIEERYDMIDEAIKKNNIQEVRSILSQIQDIDKIFRAISVKRNMQHIIAIRESLQHVVRLFKENKKVDKYLKWNQVKKSINRIQIFIASQFNISYNDECTYEHADDIDAGSLYTMNCFAKGQYKDIDEMERRYIESAELIHGIRNTITEIITKECGVKKTQKHPVCRIHYTDKSGFFLKTSTTRGDAFIKYVKKYGDIPVKVKEQSFTIQSNMYLSSLTSGEKKINSPELDELILSCRRYKEEFISQMNIQLDKVLKHFKEYYADIENISHYVSIIDFAYSNAKHAIEYHYCRPEIVKTTNDKSMMNATQLRHPLIEVLQTRETYVANDIILGEKDSEGMLIFGTNAVGKSSLIKSVGIAIILAQSGCFVPAKVFRFSPFQKIFTRILGNDNIFKGLSTFAVEMSELNMIVRNADENTLVLGDELCSGTEMGSAISIFVSGLLYLNRLQSKFMFATHFHEIVGMHELEELHTLKWKHLSVMYDKKEDMLIYNRILQDGPGNNLYGLEVCKSLRLPDDFIDMANQIRLQRYPGQKGIASRKQSRYNKEKIRINCELCGKDSDEIHHIRHQSESDEHGYIEHVHKNHKANLLSICHECHERVHKENLQLKKVKTTKGDKVIQIKS